ncbi:MAG: Smr/MutS family protein [Erythrobacter sp.]
MKHAPRGLSPSEQAAWARLAQSVTPLPGRKPPPAPPVSKPLPPIAPPAAKSSPASAPLAKQAARKLPIPPPPASPAGSLDSHWERRMKAGRLAPDLTLDLHDHSLDAAYGRIMAGLDQARSMGARVVLVIAGRERPVDPADRAERRGAIRAKLLDWLAASRHAEAIVAVRKAHRSHGGEGAIYLILKRRG